MILKDYILMFLSGLILIIFVLVGVAFLTLLEIQDDEITPEYVIPNAFDPRVATVVAEEVKRIAKEQNITR